MTELRFQILNAMADDVEQIYLAANRSSLEVGSIQPQYPLRDIIDEINSLLQEGFIKAEFCNDPKLPSRVPDGLLHHYWFCPTEKARQPWNPYPLPPLGIQ